MITGVASLQGSDQSPIVRVKVISGIQSNDSSAGKDPVVLEDNKLPGGEKSLEVLQGGVCIKGNELQAAAEAVRKAMFNLLIKKQYTSENREHRKRTRNDRKFKH